MAEEHSGAGDGIKPAPTDPKWLQTIATAATILVALGGAFLGYLKLEQEFTAQKTSEESKAKISAVEASNKLEIARLETDRKKLELEAQRSLRQTELSEQSRAKAEDADRAEAVRFSEILRNIFDSSHTSNDGVMAQLSQFAAMPRFQGAILKAVDARLRTAKSPAEVTLGFGLLADIVRPALDEVAELNRNERVDFRRALFGAFAKRQTVVFPGPPAATGQPEAQIPVRELCFGGVSTFARDNLPQSLRRYGIAVIQFELQRIFEGLVQNRPGIQWQDVPVTISNYRRAMELRVGSSEYESLPMAIASLTESQRAMSRILASPNISAGKEVIDFHECYLPDVRWPKGSLPAIDFTLAFMDRVNLEGRRLTRGTLDTLASAQVLKSDQQRFELLTIVQWPEEPGALHFDSDFR